MTWATYGEFLAFATVLVLIPGPEGTVAASGLSALIIRAQPVFQAIKWAGVAYLAYLAFLGVQAIRSAIRGQYLPLDDSGPATAGAAFGGWRQGFLSNITNPKVLIFYLARRKVRRTMDGVTGAVLLGFSARLAVEHA